MPSESPQVRVEFTPEFKRNLRALSRKYRLYAQMSNLSLKNFKRVSSLAIAYPGRNMWCSKRA